MEEAIASEAEGDAAEASLLDMQEQLDDLEFDGELAELPIGVVIASICRALGGELHLKHFADAELELTPGQSERRSLHSGPTGSTLPNN